MKTVYHIQFVFHPHIHANIAEAFATDVEAKVRAVTTSDPAVVEAVLKEKLESGQHIRVRNRYDRSDTIRLNDLGYWKVTEIRRGN